MVRTVRPNGAKLAGDLAAVLAVKDPAHYGEKFIDAVKLKATLRAAARLVEAAERLMASAGQGGTARAP